MPGGFGGQPHVLSGEDSAANGRLAKTLTGTGDFTTLAPILRGALRDNPARASVELADLSRQTQALDKQSGARLDRHITKEAKALGLPSTVAAKAPAAGGSETQAPGSGRERASRGVTSPGEEAAAANSKPTKARTPPRSKSGVQLPHRMDNASASRIVQDIASGKGELPAPTRSPDGKTDVNIGGYRLDKDAASALRMAVRATPETAAEAMREIAGLRFVPNDEPGGFVNKIEDRDFTNKFDAVQKGELVRILQDTKKGRGLSKLPQGERKARIVDLLEALDRRNKARRKRGAFVGAGFAPAGSARGRLKIPKASAPALDIMRELFGLSVSESQKNRKGNEPKSKN